MLARSRNLITRPLTAALSPRCVSTLSGNIYSAVATSTGGRAKGSAETKEGNIKLQFGLPKELGGSGDPSKANPEQLFSLAYSTCFLGAMGATHSKLNPKSKPLPKSATIRATTSIGEPADGTGGFKLAVLLEVFKKPLEEVGLDNDAQEKLVKAAHETCPYSKATHGNIEVEIKLVDS